MLIESHTIVFSLHCYIILQMPNVTCICVDIANLKETRDRLWAVGHIDLLVNNAGVTSLQSFLEVTPDEYDK